MKRYKLKITYFILLLLPLFASCTDEEIFQGSGVTEGVPTTVDISVGTAANTAKTRSALLESEERKIYNLYLWVFNSSGNVECSREYSRGCRCAHQHGIVEKYQSYHREKDTVSSGEL